MPRMTAKTPSLAPVRADDLIRGVLAEFGKRPEDFRDRSALVFTRDGLGALVLREVAVLPLAKNRDCERCLRGLQETPERLCLVCAKEVFGA